MQVIRTGIRIMLVKIANREDPDQSASSEAFFARQLVLEILEHLLYLRVFMRNSVFDVLC